MAPSKLQIMDSKATLMLLPYIHGQPQKINEQQKTAEKTQKPRRQSAA